MCYRDDRVLMDESDCDVRARMVVGAMGAPDWCPRPLVSIHSSDSPLHEGHYSRP